MVKLKAAPCGEDYTRAVDEWVKSDEEIKSQLAEVRKSQHKARQRDEKILEQVQQVDEKIEKLTERAKEDNKDKDNEMLRKLAEVNSQKVIEDHAEKYEEGTRLFFFESVEKWLDDRSSANRVMVISGNAGMGKSVIAAVICKRMQKLADCRGATFVSMTKHATEIPR